MILPKNNVILKFYFYEKKNQIPEIPNNSIKININFTIYKYTLPALWSLQDDILAQFRINILQNQKLQDIFHWII